MHSQCKVSAPCLFETGPTLEEGKPDTCRRPDGLLQKVRVVTQQSDLLPILSLSPHDLSCLTLHVAESSVIRSRRCPISSARIVQRAHYPSSTCPRPRRRRTPCRNAYSADIETTQRQDIEEPPVAVSPAQERQITCVRLPPAFPVSFHDMLTGVGMKQLSGARETCDTRAPQPRRILFFRLVESVFCGMMLVDQACSGNGLLSGAEKAHLHLPAPSRTGQVPSV